MVAQLALKLVRELEVDEATVRRAEIRILTSLERIRQQRAELGRLLESLRRIARMAA